MKIHSWWTNFGTEVTNPQNLTPLLAKEMVSVAGSGVLPGVSLIEIRVSERLGCVGVCLNVDVERPQDLAYPIQATEPVAVLFTSDGGPPCVLALRDDFPDTPHQNWSPTGTPCSLCIDDRPWAEAKLSVTAYDLVRRIQLWLSKAARGELHDTAQPPEPLFFHSQFGLVLPASALAGNGEPIELAGYMRPDNENLILSRPVIDQETSPPLFIVLAFKAQPQGMTRLRRAPKTLAALASELEKCGIHLYDELRTRLKAWAGLERADVRRLTARLAVVVAFPVAGSDSYGISDFRAFLTIDSAGEIGVALGVLYPNTSRVGDVHAYMTAIPENQNSARELCVEPAQVHFTLSRDLASAIAGHGIPDRRRLLMIGAGSLGSQLSANLARQGSFVWTIVDDEHLLPHNLVRHALFAEDVGAPKAEALALKLGALLGEKVEAIQCDILNPQEKTREPLAKALSESDILIDAAASVAVSRHLSDLSAAKARRVAVFFNPSGTAIVLLVENVDRTINLRDLEAQYHRLVQVEPLLATHLSAGTQGVRYSGSCRALTNRIPGSNAALLSALAARGMTDRLAAEEASISIWVIGDNDEVHLVRRPGAPVNQVQLGGWTVAYDSGLLSNLMALRKRELPNETGGVLLGIADMNKRFVHIAHAMSQPEDSRGTIAGFERGVSGLVDTVSSAISSSMHQLRYVGEWHSHPDMASAMPSTIDVSQLLWLESELENEGLPGLMAIAAQDGQFAFALSSRMRERG
jgi:hypothetical protein